MALSEKPLLHVKYKPPDAIRLFLLSKEPTNSVYLIYRTAHNLQMQSGLPTQM